MKKYILAKILLTTTLFPLSATANNFDALNELSFESLGNIVTSVSKRPEDSFKSAAAISVITQEDIKLSGATHISEVLRMVPGLNIARADSSSWAISSRGFNGTNSNKLLVLIDGRTVYTPLFSGVYWDVQDVVLEDIERIEVIRGPGATQWGANAVNGVINITTKSAEKTQGVYLSQTIGTEDRSISEGRYGGVVGKDLFYRAYVKHAVREASENLDDTNGRNDWDSAKSGMRLDYDNSSGRKLMLTGDIYQSDNEFDLFPPTTTSPFFSFNHDELNAKGGNILGKWTENHGDGLESNFQTYYEYQSRRYSQLNQSIATLDFDYQTSWQYNDRHQLVWGAGYRYQEDDLDGTKILSFSKSNRSYSLYSAFAQDTIALVPKTLDLTLGSKFEHNDYSGFEMQPSARLAYYPSENHTLWGAVSRAVRTPSRAEHDIRLNVQYDPTFGVIVQQFGDRSMDSERLVAYEVGHRWKVNPKLMFDSTAYYNDYDNLRTFEFGTPYLSGTDVILPALVKSLGEGRTYGFEVASTWDVTDRWSLKGAYSYINMDVNTKPGSSDIVLEGEEDKIPHHQFNLRSQYYITDDVDLTNTFYYVDELPLYGVEDYLRMDARLGWKVANGIEAALVGQNLLDNTHAEFGAPLHGLANQIERQYYAKITFQY